MSTIRHHIEMTHLDSGGNKYILYPKNTLADVHTNSTSGVTIDGKVNFYGTCTTAAVTAAKTASISGFTLAQGQHVTIAFTNGITVASPTLNINSLGAKAIYHKGAALKANVIKAGARVQLVYDGTNFEVLNFDAPYAQNNNTTKFYLLGTPNAENGVPSDQYFDTGVYVSPTDGQLVAKSFSGNGSALTNLNAGNITSGTVGADRLPTSGATAGTYGENAGDDTSLAHSGSLVVPKISLDKYGRITSAENIVYTMPANENTDEKVKVTQNATTKAYVTGTTTANGNAGGLLYDPNVYLDTTSGRFHAATMNSNTYYLGDTSNYIDSSNYTGTAANVGTLSEWLVDSCASDSANGVTNQALTANQGYLLQNQIDELNCNSQNLVIIKGYLENVDIDTVLDSGIYYVKGNTEAETCLNLPQVSAGRLMVYDGNGSFNSPGSPWIYKFQEFTTINGRVYRRSYLTMHDSDGVTVVRKFEPWARENPMVESGKINNWNYIKYQNGYCKAWCVASGINGATSDSAGTPSTACLYPFNIYNACPQFTLHGGMWFVKNYYIRELWDTGFALLCYTVSGSGYDSTNKIEGLISVDGYWTI